MVNLPTCQLANKSICRHKKSISPRIDANFCEFPRHVHQTCSWSSWKWVTSSCWQTWRQECDLTCRQDDIIFSKLTIQRVGMSASWPATIISNYRKSFRARCLSTPHTSYSAGPIDKKKLVCFMIKTAHSHALHHSLHMKLFQLAMGVHVVETDIFKFNFLNFYISEIELFILYETCTFYVK